MNHRKSQEGPEKCELYDSFGKNKIAPAFPVESMSYLYIYSYLDIHLKQIDSALGWL